MKEIEDSTKKNVVGKWLIPCFTYNTSVHKDYQGLLEFEFGVRKEFTGAYMTAHKEPGYISAHLKQKPVYLLYKSPVEEEIQMGTNQPILAPKIPYKSHSFFEIM